MKRPGTKLLELDLQSQLKVSPEERALLDDRLREDDEHPDAAIPWADARARLLAR